MDHPTGGVLGGGDRRAFEGSPGPWQGLTRLTHLRQAMWPRPATGTATAGRTTAISIAILAVAFPSVALAQTVQGVFPEVYNVAPTSGVAFNATLAGGSPALAIDGDAGTSWVFQAAGPGPGGESSLTLDLRGEFEIFEIIASFASGRPAAAVIERSSDGGATFTAYQYFSASCQADFGLPPTVGGADGTNVICTPSFSQASAGIIAFRLWTLTQQPEVVTGQPQFASLYAFSLATHVRLRILRPVTSSQLTYAMSSVQVLARLNCNGHGNATSGSRTCSCVHNTAGPNCGQCAPLANGRPYARWTTVTPATCVPCACNNHAVQCEYNVILEGGVCTDCDHNTSGTQCEQCSVGFYRPLAAVDLTAPDVCSACDCLQGGTSTAVCVRDVFTAPSGAVPGECLCKERVGGARCDSCLPGFTDLHSNNPEGCSLCSACSSAGSVSSNLCSRGTCDCKPTARGALCDTCAPGYFNLSSANPNGCQPCACNDSGSTGTLCDAETGQCQCQTGYTGRTCGSCADGFRRAAGVCIPCGCSSVGSTNTSCSAEGACNCRSGYTGDLCTDCAVGFYSSSQGCAACACNSLGTRHDPNICNRSDGQCLCKTFVEGRTCDTCIAGFAVLQASNPDGCSGTPGGLGSPEHTIIGTVDSPAVRLMWQEPTQSAGPITQYVLARGTGAGGQFVDVRIDALATTFTDVNVTPGVLYFYSLRASTAAGAVTAETASVLIPDAVPNWGRTSGPTVVVNSSRSIVVRFSLPEHVNGRSNVYTAVANATGNVVSTSSSAAHNSSHATLSNLMPYTRYRLHAEACNTAGCSSSPVSVHRTSPAQPEGLSAPVVERTARADELQVTWVAAQRQNGLLDRYVILMIAPPGASVIHPEVGRTRIIVPGLTPETQYRFAVQSYTVGVSASAVSNFTLATTPSSNPEAVMPPTIVQIGQRNLSAIVHRPAIPNGEIASYEIQANGAVVQRGAVAGTYVVRSLTPFTRYELSVRVCTRPTATAPAGCTVSDVVNVTTSAAPPEGQGSPHIDVTNATSLIVSWSSPSEPNSLLRLYEVHRQVGADGGFTQVAQVSHDDSIEEYTFSDTNLQPYTSFTYFITVRSDHGANSGPHTTARTLIAVPTGAQSPHVALHGGILRVNATLPTRLNGPYDSTTAYLRSPSSPSSEVLLCRGIDLSCAVNTSTLRLAPASQYEVRTTISNSRYEIASSWVIFTSVDEVPTLSQSNTAPAVLDVGSTWALLRWNITSGMNGAALNASILYANASFTAEELAATGSSAIVQSYNLTGLAQGGQYTVRIRICNSAGCSSGGATPIQTDAVPPSSVALVEIVALNDTAVQLTWSPAYSPNSPSPVAYSISRRQAGGTAAVIGVINSTLSFVDAGLLADTLYTFDIVAFNSVGRSPPSSQSIVTPQGAPSGVPIPLVNESTSTLQQFVWEEPRRNNGVLANFTLFVNGLVACVIPYAGTAQAAYTCVVDDLLAFTTYDVRLEACTIAGCGRSEVATIRTAEATPSNLAPPGLIPGDARGFGAVWTSPAVANGIITHYDLWVSGPLNTPGAISTERTVDLVLETSAASTTALPRTTVSAAATSASETVRFDLLAVHNNDAAVPYVSGAYVFNGSAGLEIFNYPTASASFSVAIQFLGQTGRSGYLFAKSDAAGSRFYSLYMTASTRQVYLFYRVVGDSSVRFLRFSVWLNDGGQHTVMLSINGTAASLLVDTSFSETQELAGLVDDCGVRTADCIMFIGQRPSISGGVSRFYGRVSAALFYPRDALTIYPSFSQRLSTPTTPSPTARLVATTEPAALTATFTRVFSGNRTVVLVNGTVPFTQYTVFVDAHNSAGFTSSPAAFVTTVPSVPEVLAIPQADITGGLLTVIWTLPLRPNGIISHCDLVDRNRTTVYSGSALRHTIDAAPYSTFELAVSCFNQVSSVTSETLVITTPAAPPQLISPPRIGAGDSVSVSLSWGAPIRVHDRGIVNYSLWSNGLEVYSGNGSVLEVTLRGLNPFTTYRYAISACNSVGCIRSNTTDFTTDEAGPTGQAPPVARRVEAQRVELMWTPPRAPNGRILEYVLNRTDLNRTDSFGVAVEFTVFRGSALSFVDTIQIFPARVYLYQIVSVNSNGSARSTRLLVSTPPRASVTNCRTINSTTIAVAWIPDTREDDIVYRLLWSDGSQSDNVADTVGTVHVLNNLRPHTNFTFRVASCFRGTSCNISESATCITRSAAPAAVQLPSISATGPTSFTAAFSPPTFPNGVISSYTILVLTDSSLPLVFEAQYGAFSINITHPSLRPFTVYTFSLRVCVDEELCTVSNDVVARSGEDRPLFQPDPIVSAIANTTMNVSMFEPPVPNGIITRYRLLYRNAPATHRRRRQTGDCDEFFDETNCVQSGCSWDAISFSCSASATATQPDQTTAGAQSCFDLFTQQECDGQSGCAWDDQFSFCNEGTTQPGNPTTDGGGATTAAGGTTAQSGGGGTTAPSTSCFDLFTQQECDGQSGCAWDDQFSFCNEGTTGQTTRVATTNAATTVQRPTSAPTSAAPTAAPSLQPTRTPTSVPTRSPSVSPSTLAPTTAEPTSAPSSLAPSSAAPTETPTTAVPTTAAPTAAPTGTPTWSPTASPTEMPSAAPTAAPTSSIRVAYDGPYVPFVVVDELQPFVEYEFQVESSTSAGSRASNWVSNSTLDGIPQRVLAPVILTNAGNFLRVLLVPPTIPRGRIIAIIVYIDDVNVGAYASDSVVIVAGLEPYRTYSLASQACTRAGCERSAIETVRMNEAPPSWTRRPNVTESAARSVTVEWATPRPTNGQIAQYTVRSHTYEDCTAQESFSAVPPSSGCSYLVCGARESVCGLRCFSNSSQVCCDGSVFDREPGFACCGSTYVREESGQTCCGSRMVPSRPGYHCCGDLYAPMSSDEICCDGAVGRGNSCCGAVAFVNTPTAPRVCCGGRVFAFSPQRQCCGGQMVPSVLQCCTDDSSGVSRAHAPSDGKVCCGTDSVFANVTTCCEGQAHYFRSTAIKAEDTRVCCGRNLISGNDSCCNGEGYDPTVNSCSDRSTGASAEQCGSGSLCLLSQANSAYCDICGFDTNRASCFAIPQSDVDAHAATFDYHTEDGGTVHTLAANYESCALVVCGADQSSCNGTCYDDDQVCCNGVLHNFNSSHQCCGEAYVAFSSPSDVCCGGAFHPREADRQCCGGVYSQVSVGEICCDGTVGVGTSCCGTVAFTDSNERPLICCGGQLHLRDQDDVGQSCCGGSLISGDMECCGDQVAGEAYLSSPLMECCGTGYIQSASSLCCEAASGEAISYDYSSPGQKIRAGDECCGSQRIQSGTGCCNEQPFDPATSTCSQGSTAQQCAATVIEGALCNASVSAAAAQCGSCAFDAASSSCFLHQVSRSPLPYTCPVGHSDTAPISSGATSSIVTGLLPFTQYRFTVSATTGGGSASSDPSYRVRSLEDVPEGVISPVVRPLSTSTVNITWDPPRSPNGIIREYHILRRVGRDISTILQTDSIGYRLIELSGGPYSAISVALTACTSVGCTTSPFIVGHTRAGPPDHVSEPAVLALAGGTAVNVSWLALPPLRGIVQFYHLDINGSRVTVPGNVTHTAVRGLLPFTEYNFTLTACTSGGCTSGTEVFAQTSEAAPSGPLAPPNIFVLGPTRVEVSWSAPSIPNGIIVQYVIYRNGTAVHSTNGSTNVFVDSNLLPHTRYEYSYSAATSFGATVSITESTNTPESSPEGFAAPACMSISSTAIRISWVPPTLPHGRITDYIILRGNSSVGTSVGVTFASVVFDLNPHTAYDFRVLACTQGGCSASSAGCENTTLEATPVGQRVPQATALNTTAVELTWGDPATPNGVISRFVVEERIDEFNSTVVYDGPLRAATHSGLLPYSLHQYRVIAFNSAGSVASGLVLVRTAEGAPEGVHALTVSSVISTSADVAWQPPSRPNGVIGYYEIVDRGRNETFYRGGLNRALITVQPFSNYSLTVLAFTNGGVGASPVTNVSTPEALPASVQSVQVSNLSASSATLLWLPPLLPNGRILYYAWSLAQDTENRSTATSATVSQLQPFTQYTVSIAACNSIGCGPRSNRSFRTLESAPTGVSHPNASAVSATSILVRWDVPLSPHGIIRSYTIYRITESTEESIAYSGVDRVFADVGLRPFTQYSYYVVATNGAGSTSSNASGMTFVRTFEAPPVDMAPPTVTPVGDARLNISWAAPSLPNGIILYYTLRGRAVVNGQGSLAPSLFFNGSSLFFLIDRLPSETTYEFSIQAVNSAGSVASAFAQGTTCAARPREQTAPNATTTSTSSIAISWDPPAVTQGVPMTYKLLVIPSTDLLSSPTTHQYVYVGNATSFSASNLSANTPYTVVVRACRSSHCADAFACTPSPAVSVSTLQGVPQGVHRPTALALSSTDIEVTWSPPTVPNGIVTYIVFRNVTGVFNGTALRFVDERVQPETTYSYTVTVRTAGGTAVSPSVHVRTPAAGSPYDFRAPLVEVLTATVVRVCWQAPRNAAASVVYSLLLDSASPRVLVTQPQRLCTVVEDLAPFSEHTFRIRACNGVACAGSVATIARTLCGSPSAVLPQLTVSGISVSLSWRPPPIPNCNTTNFTVDFTRGAPGSGSPIESVEAGYATSVTINGLQHSSVYNFRVVAFNPAERTVGPWVAATTTTGSPVGLAAPLLDIVGGVALLVRWLPPTSQNGDVVEYTLLQTVGTPSGGNTSIVTAVTNLTSYVVHDLRPAVSYTFHVQACTAALLCVASARTGITMPERAPAGVVPPRFSALHLTPYNITVEWAAPPAAPNGVLLGYRAEIKACVHPCVMVVSTRTVNVTMRVAVLDAIPATSYSARVVAFNAAGENASSWVTTFVDGTPLVTPSGVPSVVGRLRLRQMSLSSVELDWSSTFRANGPILGYNISTVPNVLHHTYNASVSSIVFDVDDNAFAEASIYRVLFRVVAFSDGGPSEVVAGNVTQTIHSSTTTTTMTTQVAPQAAAAEAVSQVGVGGIVIAIFVLAAVAFFVCAATRPESKLSAVDEDALADTAVATEFEQFWIAEEMAMEKGPRLQPYVPPPPRPHVMDTHFGDEEIPAGEAAASYDLNEIYLAGIGDDSSDGGQDDTAGAEPVLLSRVNDVSGECVSTLGDMQKADRTSFLWGTHQGL